MKKLYFVIGLLIILFPLEIRAVGFTDSCVGCGGGVASSGCPDSSCWSTFREYVGANKTTSSFQALRITIYNEKGDKVSNSVDFANSNYQLLSGKNFYSVKDKKSKIDYLKEGDTGNFTFSLNKGANIYYLDFPDYLSTKTTDKTLLWLLSKYVKGKNNLISAATTAFSFCTGSYASRCTEKSLDKYYVVVEPATVIALTRNDTKSSFYGTYYELKRLYNQYPYTSKEYNNARTVVTRYLPNSIKLGTEHDKFKIFYNNVGLDYLDNNSRNLSGINDNNDSFGLGVAKAGDYNIPDPPTPEPIKQTFNCPITVSINECGDSTITEPTSNNCLKNNSLYSYIPECNLYCSDTISTNLGDVYSTFIGKNKYSAIQSGKYISINGNPKIKITKTCYQSASSSACSNWQESLRIALENNYRNNYIKLVVDGTNDSGEIKGGNSYTLTATPVITTTSSGATIEYEYKMANTVNKYISIGTMRSVTDSSDNTITLNSTSGSIMTKKTSYGAANYYLDLSATVLNKYSAGSKTIEQTKHSTSEVITTFNNTATITYTNASGSSKNSYTSTNNANVNSNDMYYECSYHKYNTEDGCLCNRNECCDPITCKGVSCPSTCTCTAECGCKDDGNCTPNDCLKPTVNRGTICDPEVETCFPNVVYRPISLTNPFPGISGGGRTPGDNWNKLVRNSDGSLLTYNGNTVTAYDYYIKYNRGYNDYEVYQAQPLYIIKLDSKIMDEIKKYNKAHGNNYNDFDLRCQNGEKCISKFLRGDPDSGFGINLIDGGTCKDITHASFDSCVSRRY